MQAATSGLVLRQVKVGNADKILTLLTPTYGIISASARGSLRLKNKLFNACGLFCFSEFSLTQGRSTWFVDDAQVKQVFYGLGKTVEGMALAMYLAELTILLEPTETEAEEQLRLLLNSLYLISEQKKPPALVKAAYEMRTMAQTGYMPDLLCCAGCQKYDGGDFCLEMTGGRLLCADCAAKEGKRTNLDTPALTALRHICLVDSKKVFSFSLAPASMQKLSKATELYALRHLDHPIKTLDFLKTVLE